MDPVTYHAILSDISPWISPLTTLLILGVGGLVGYGKLKATSITHEKCKNEQDLCQGKILKEIREVKDLVIELHGKQTDRTNFLNKEQADKIEAVDKRRHDDRNEMHKVLLIIQKDIGIVSGYVRAAKIGKSEDLLS